METLNLALTQGKTFTKVIRWEKEPFLYAAIASITKGAPCRIVTGSAHGIPDGWRVAVVSAGGMRQINAESSPPKDREFVRATVINSTTVDLNTVNSSGYTTYTSGGYLQFYTPASLLECLARLVIRDRIGGTALLELDESDGIVLDDTDKTITITITAAQTAAMEWTKGVYELEIEDDAGVVTGLFKGSVTVSPEVTT